MGGRTLLERRVLPPPHPLTPKNFEWGLFFIFTHLLTDEIGRFVADLRARCPTFGCRHCRLFCFYTPADGWCRESRCEFRKTMPDIQSFRPPFSKGGAVKGAEPLSPIAMGETPLILPKTQERVNFFALQRKRENPRRGFSFCLFCVCRGGRELF